MLKVLKNKKGFTLVELLAVIVILALIMGIMVFSMTNVIQTARENSFRRTASNIVNGVRDQIMAANEPEVGDYYFTQVVFEKGSTESPLGGDYQFVTSTEGLTMIGKGVYRAASALTCSDDGPSFVRITQNAASGVYTYSICLTAGDGENYIDLATETALNDDSAQISPTE